MSRPGVFRLTPTPESSDTDRELLPRPFVAAVALVAALALTAIALLGPAFLGRIQYPTSKSAIWQGEALDLVNLGLMVPLLLAGALLLVARRPGAKYLLVLPALNLGYAGLGYGVGMEWGNPAYSGNSYQYAPLFLLLIPASLLLTIGCLSMFRDSDAPVLPRRSILRFAAVMVPFLLVFAVLWLRQVGEVVITGTLGDGTYGPAPTGFWLVRFLDLGVTIPLGLLTPYLLLRRPRQAYPLALLIAGYMVTLGTTVVVMAGILWAHQDPSVTGSNAVQLVIFPVLAAFSYWVLYFLLRTKLPWYRETGTAGRARKAGRAGTTP